MDINILKPIPLFSSLLDRDLRFLAENLTETEVEAGTVIIREDEEGDCLYIVLDGQVEVFKTLGSQEIHSLGIQNSGDFFGEMSLINRDRKRTASVCARTKVHLLMLSQENFDTLLKRQPELAVEIMRELSARLRETDNAIIRDLQRMNQDLTQAYDLTLEGWAKALELRDQGTEGHTRRVTEATLKLALGLGIDGDTLNYMRRGAMLHDIGKMGIPDLILLKPGKLTDEEWLIMRKHPVYAYDMLYHIEFLRPALDIPYCHHEKWDGSGYPRGLKKEEIPISARIFAVIDVWDALISDRPYRKAISHEETLSYISSLAGSHFDPNIARTFLSMQEKFGPEHLITVKK